MKSAEMHKLIDCSEPPKKPQNKSAIQRQQQIVFFTNLLKRKQINIEQFLEAMAKKYILPLNSKTNQYKILDSILFNNIDSVIL